MEAAWPSGQCVGLVIHPAVPSSRPTLTTTWICFSVAGPLVQFLGHVNSHLVKLRPVGILNVQYCYVQFEIFVSIVSSAPLALVL